MKLSPLGLPKNIIDIYEAKEIILKAMGEQNTAMSVFDGLRFRKVYSPIHNLDPRIKFVYVISIFVVAIFFVQIIPLLLLFLLQVPFVLLARVQRQWLRSLRGAAFLAALIFVINIATTYFTSGYTLTALNMENAASLTLRFVVLVESFSVFFLTTSPDHLGLGAGRITRTLRICFRLHYSSTVCSCSGRRSPNNYGCTKSQRTRT